MDDQHDLRARPGSQHEEPLPLPNGTPIYESLTSRFISFERLLTTLADTNHSGFVRMVAPEGKGVLLFRNGRVVDSLDRRRGELLMGRPAHEAIAASVESGEGVLDVVSLAPDLVDGLHNLASGNAAYPEMRASWVNIGGLVGFLEGRAFTGSISVRSGAGAGVIILSAGRVTGSFTTESGELEPDAEAVMALCADAEAQIEVRSEAGSRPAWEAPVAEGQAQRPEPAASPVGTAVSEFMR